MRFWFIFLFFFGSYTALHVLFYLRTRAAFRMSRIARAALSAFLALMVVCPVWVRMLDRAGWTHTAHLIGITSYVWMAMVFWFAGLAVAAAVWNFLARAAARRWPRLSMVVVRPRAAWFAMMAAVVAMACWGLFEASLLRTKEIAIRTPHRPAGSVPLRILQISDVHLGKPRGRALLEKLVAKVRDLNPDVLVSTGDLVDSAYGNIRDLAPLLDAVRPPLGKFAVLGNHEYYAGARGSVRFHEDAGFRLLRADAYSPAEGLCIAGVDDEAGHYTGQPSFTDEARALAPCERESFVVLLKHQPRVLPASLGRFDLQLSGHTHGGQILPFGLLVRAIYPHLHGMHRLGSRSLLHISRGAGTWGPPMRLLAPPEVTVITLLPEKE